MLGIIGVVLATGGGWVAWWAFHQAEVGDDFYGWVWPVALIIGVLGILLFIFRFRKWWMSE